MTRPVAYLHIGLMKTGTTYLQSLLTANSDALAEGAGVFFARGSWQRQVRAVENLMGLDQLDPRVASLSVGAWPELVAEIQGRRSGATLVSMEFLSHARRRHLARVRQDLQGVDVHVIVTVRDATSAIPAQWQTSITSGATHSWPDFQDGVRRAVGPLWRVAALRDAAVRELRRSQDLDRVLRHWGELVPADRLHVVTVPGDRRQPDLLWRRFADVLGVDPALATEPASETNPSLGYPSAELLRRVNLGLDDLLAWDYNGTVKAPLGTKILAARRRDERRPHLSLATEEFARDWNRRSRRAVERSGACLVGDLADLPIAPTGGEEPDQVEPTSTELVAAAGEAWRGLTTVIRRRRRRLTRITGSAPPPALETTAPDWTRPGATSSADVDGAVRDLGGLVRTAVQLRRDIAEAREADDTDDTDDDSASSSSS